jgi:xanthine dehydrogenase FAD-binding subunit
MGAPFNHQIYYPSSFNELFSIWNNHPSAVLYAGGTDFTRRQGKLILELPEKILCLDQLQELHRITRTEHYLEIGSMAKLNNLIHLGKIIPETLRDCLENIGGVQIRNIATIGGNICCQMLDISAPLIALDAQYELKDSKNTRWVSAARFHSSDDTSVLKKDSTRIHPVLNNQEILTRIRLPLHRWNYSMYKKFYKSYSNNKDDDFKNIIYNKTLTFMARTQKNNLADIRVVYKKNNTILRNKNAEGILIGKYLPISKKTAADFIENWEEFISDYNEHEKFTENEKIDEFSKYALINCIAINIHHLSE